MKKEAPIHQICECGREIPAASSETLRCAACVKIILNQRTQDYLDKFHKIRASKEWQHLTEEQQNTVLDMAIQGDLALQGHYEPMFELVEQMIESL